MEDISGELATIRDELTRQYQLTGLDEDQHALAEAIAFVSAAEERLRRAFLLTNVA